MNRDATYDHDCRTLMDGLPASVAGRGMDRGEQWTLKLNQRAVNVLYLALAHSLAGVTDAKAEPTDEQLSAMLGPALAATIRLGGTIS